MNLVSQSRSGEAAAADNNGRVYEIKKIGNTANVVIDGNAAETIDGELTQTLLFKDEAIKIHSDGSNWRILA